MINDRMITKGGKSPLLLALMCSANAVAGEGLVEALGEGEYALSFRYRIETVDQATFSQDAEASTLRTRISYRSGDFLGFFIGVEMDNVAAIAWDDYNSTRNGQTQYPVVADPTGTEVNQALLGYRFSANHTLTVGRQRIALDSKRYLGYANWRQNEQTYDALTFTGPLLSSLTLDYGYINKAHTVFGPDAGTPPAAFDSNSNFVNLTYDWDSFGRLVAYGYWLDLENAPALSTRTLGARFQGDTQARETTIDYTLEWAQQHDYGDNPVPYHADYLWLETGISQGGLRGAIGVERLGGDANAPGMAFRTPLAGLHKYQGWTDQFVSTPGDGVEDKYLTIAGALQGINLKFVYHWFDAAATNTDFGTEWGIVASRSLNQYGTVLFKYASYDADGFGLDTDKFWLQYAVSFE